VTNWTPLSVPQYNRPDLFIRLESEQSRDGSSIPDWWEAQYGLTNVDPNAQDSAGDGYTIYQKYALGVNPSTWLTPAAPQGLAVKYNANNSTATLSWLPSKGNVTGYTVQKNYACTWTNTTQNIPVSGAAYTDNVSTNQPNPWQGGTISVAYAVQAHYSGGDSALTPSAPLQAPSFAGNINNGSQGSVTLNVAAMPANTTGIRLMQVDWYAIDLGNLANAYVTNFIVPVSSITNLVYSLPNVKTARGNSDLAWEGQAIQSDGNASSYADLSGTFQTAAYANNSWMAPPFLRRPDAVKAELDFSTTSGSD
jgi:hypothetical protein